MKINCNYNSKSFPLVFSVFVLLIYFSQKQISELNDGVFEKKQFHTSIWCHTTKFGNKKCLFNNLCYNTDGHFLFILTENSIFSGVQGIRDLTKIKTSSISNHSEFFLKVTMVDPSHPFLNKISLIQNNVFAISRFKPDNILHVIHDDLLPLFNTYKELCLGNVSHCKLNYKLIFIDNNESGPYLSWYKAFSLSEPISLVKFAKGNTICFNKIHIGMDEETIIYQYGFKIPQGSVNSNLSPSLLYDFKEYILKHFSINSLKPPDRYTLISRKLTRKILNEDYIEQGIKHYSASDDILLTIDESVNSSVEILHSIASSKLLLGMHGAGMILSIFLPKNSNVLELFPLGIKRDYVSPLFALSKINGIYFKYFSWTNYNKSNTVEHPDYPLLLGGINHLPTSKQKEIKNSLFVPAMICCHNPLYLFRMYQDTIVDDSILSVIKESVTFKNNATPNILTKQWYFPGYVMNFRINYSDGYLYIYWNPPINLSHNQNVKYNLSLLSNVKNFTTILRSNNVTLKLGKLLNYCEGWISCIIEDVEGLDTYGKCII